MLQKELEGIDAEVIKQPWSKGILKAKGSFVCLLEKNSAVSPGSIKKNLEEFISNPKYRKLAMVSPRIDLPTFKDAGSWTYESGLALIPRPTSNEFHSTRIGQAHGAIIRRSSLLKANLPYKMHPHAFSLALSLYFWENGLRIALEPSSIYYAPENVSYSRRMKPKPLPVPSDNVLNMWQREWIS